MFSLVPFCHILVLLSCKIRLLTGPIPQVCGGNASREAASPKRRPSCWASRPDNSMQDLSCSQTYRFLARTCCGSVSLCVCVCVSVHTYSCWRWFLGTLASSRFPKRICSTTIGCLFDDVRWIDFRVVRAETSKRHRNTHELTEPRHVLARNLYACDQLRSCMLLSGRDAY